MPGGHGGHGGPGGHGGHGGGPRGGGFGGPGGHRGPGGMPHRGPMMPPPRRYRGCCLGGCVMPILSVLGIAALLAFIF